MSELVHAEDNSHIIQWSIENFSSSTRQHGKELECLTSTAGNLFHTLWTLVIYPKGKNDPNFLSCFLRRKGKENNGPYAMDINYEFSLITFDGVQAYRRSGEAEFRRNSSFGFEDFLKLEDIFCRKEILLQSDTLTLRCRLRMIGPIKKHISRINYVTEFPLQKLSTFLKFDNFRGTTKQNPRIFALHFSKDLLSLNVSLNKDETSNEQIQEPTDEDQNPESFLHIVMTKKKAEDRIYISCWIKVLNNNMDVVIEKEMSHLFSKTFENEEWVLPYFIDTDNLQDDCIQDETLILQVECTICDSKPQTLAVKKFLPFPSTADPRESTLKEDMEHLQTTGEFSDVILRVGDETFPAHKCILAARSPRFQEIFTSIRKETTDSNEHIVEIVDVDKNTMALLLKFIYYCKLEDMDDEMSLLLYSAAQKYQISSLRVRCVDFLKNLSAKGVYQALVVAEEWNDTELKLVALDYILHNYQSVLLTPEWQTFNEDHEELADLIMGFVELKKGRKKRGLNS